MMLYQAVLNTDNDLETTYLELEKVTNMDSNQNEIKLEKCKLVHLKKLSQIHSPSKQIW